MTILIVIYTYVTQNRYSNNNYIENNLNKNNANRLLSLCEFNIIFPGKMKEKEITTKSGYVINSYLSAIKSPPLLRAECIPVNLHANENLFKPLCETPKPRTSSIHSIHIPVITGSITPYSHP